MLTFSRGGALGAIAGVIAVLLVYRKPMRDALLSMGAGLLAGAGVALSVGPRRNSLGFFRFWNFTQSSYAGGVGTRSELWRAAITLWRQHPLLGIGAGNFEFDIPFTGLRGVRTHANSLYLQALVEGGRFHFSRRRCGW